MDELLAKHKKELKSYDGEKRTAMKKVKGTSGKGKKGKEALEKAENEWKQKQEEILQRHTNEINALSSTSSLSPTANDTTETTVTFTPATTTQQQLPNENNNTKDDKSDQDQRRQKANAKKAQKRQAERDRQRAVEAARIQETNDAGPSAREVELSRLTELYLAPSKLTIQEITADGNCLYRAISAQLVRLGNGKEGGYEGIRKLCADALDEGREDYAPFADLEVLGVDDFDGYVRKVRDSNEWGGHLELRALAVGLGRTIVVYSADSAPLCIEGKAGDASVDDENAIRLSFHKSYYALGEHYNSVIKMGD